MNIIEKIKSFGFLWSLIRQLPVYSILFTFTLFFITFNISYLLITIYIVSSLLLNLFLKNFVFYNLRNSLSFLGTFYRPNLKKACLPFANLESTKISMGMPSGHSQVIATMVTFFLFNIWYEEIMNIYYPDNNVKKIFHTIIAICILLITMFSRILDDCHTLSQTIVGTIIGVLYGTGIYFLHRKIKSKIPISNQY